MVVGAYSVVNFMAAPSREKYQNSFNVLKKEAAQRGLTLNENFIRRYFLELFLGQWIYAGLCIASMLGAVVAAKHNEVLAFLLACVAPSLAVTVAVLHHRLVRKSDSVKTTPAQSDEPK